MQPWVRLWEIKGRLKKEHVTQLLEWLLKTSDERRTPAVSEHPSWTMANTYRKGHIPLDFLRDKPIPGLEEFKACTSQTPWAFFLEWVRPNNLYRGSLHMDPGHTIETNDGVDVRSICLTWGAGVDLIFEGVPKGDAIRGRYTRGLKGEAAGTGARSVIANAGYRAGLFRELYVLSLVLRLDALLEYFRHPENKFLFGYLPDEFRQEVRPQPPQTEAEPSEKEADFVVSSKLWKGKTLNTAFDALKAADFPPAVIAYVLFHWCGFTNKRQLGELLYAGEKDCPDDSTCNRLANKLLKEAATLKIVQG